VEVLCDGGGVNVSRRQIENFLWNVSRLVMKFSGSVFAVLNELQIIQGSILRKCDGGHEEIIIVWLTRVSLSGLVSVNFEL